MDLMQYIRNLGKKPSTVEHTRFFNAIPQPCQEYLSNIKGSERRNTLQMLEDIVRDGNAKYCVNVLVLALQNGISDVDRVKR